MVGELRTSHVIHLHRLLAAVRAEFEADGMDAERLREYEDHGVAPVAFKATKADHERAVLTLAAALADWADEELAADDEAGRQDDAGITERDRPEAGATR